MTEIDIRNIDNFETSYMQIFSYIKSFRLKETSLEMKFTTNMKKYFICKIAIISKKYELILN